MIIYLVTDHIPFLLIVVLSQKFHFVRWQIHRSLAKTPNQFEIINKKKKKEKKKDASHSLKIHKSLKNIPNGLNTPLVDWIVLTLINSN